MSSSIPLNFLSNIGKYSIFFFLAGPIYVFSTDNYKNDYKLSIAILTIVVAITTYFYWGNSNEKDIFWKFLDRAIASSIIILTFIEGDKYIRGFIGASIFLFLLGQSGGFVSHYSYINHIGFRSFGATAVLLYLASDNSDVRKIFLSLNLFFTFFLVYLSIKQIKLSLEYNKIKNIKENLLIF